MIFRRMIFATLAVGTVQTGVQQLQVLPIILAAEVYEDQKVEAPAAPAAAHTHTHFDATAHDRASVTPGAQWAPDSISKSLVSRRRDADSADARQGETTTTRMI